MPVFNILSPPAVVTPRPPVQRTILNATPERARELSAYVMEHAEGLPDWAKKIVEKERNGGQHGK